jgi:diadenosine tetraphosphate (Ap4A) HIT family hydrolase
MSCPLCNASALADRVFFRGHGWFAMLDANPLVAGHTILVRETPGSCPDALTAGSLEHVQIVAPRIAEALKDEYSAINVLITSLRGLVAHMHVHLLPLRAEDERTWRAESGWNSGHLHQFLGDQDRASSIRNLQERIDQGWSEDEQRVAHTRLLSDRVGKLRARLEWRA